MNGNCPRCDAAFHCGARDAAPCACTALTLDAGLLAELRERYAACLCLRCLRELSEREPGKAGPVPRPALPSS